MTEQTRLDFFGSAIFVCVAGGLVVAAVMQRQYQRADESRYSRLK
jgi:hypothetical protein